MMRNDKGDSYSSPKFIDGHMQGKKMFFLMRRKSDSDTDSKEEKIASHFQ